MTANGQVYPNAHISAQFREAFASWHQFHQFVAERATTAEFDADRALHQILTADFAARLTTATPHDWLLFGSLALPVRPSTEDPWPIDLAPTQDTAVESAYVMARSAFDLDLSALDVTHPDPVHAAQEFGQQMMQAVQAVTADPAGRNAERALGLGGLVHYTADVSIHPTGKLMGVIIAQPVDPRYGAHNAVPVDDPIALEIDIKPPNRVRLFGPPDPAHRSLVGLDVPGFSPVMPAVYPTASQLADKVTMISGPPPESARRIGSGPWHRYKDVFDIYYMIKTCRVDADQFREAIRVNNQDRFGREELPSPYRAYGQEPQAGEKPIPWYEACEALRAEQPQLAGYPPFAGMQEAVSGFIADLRTAPPGATWIPTQGWTMQGTSKEQAHTEGERRAPSAAAARKRSTTIDPSKTTPKKAAPANPASESTHRRPGRDPKGRGR